MWLSCKRVRDISSARWKILLIDSGWVNEVAGVIHKVQA